MAKLRRLKIEKFRNVVPGTELRFHDGFNVLLGQNGTGKTNLLKLVAMALSSDFSQLEREAFAIEYEIEVGQVAVTVGLRNQLKTRHHGLPDIARHHINIAADEAGASTDWSYSARILGDRGALLARLEGSPFGASVTIGTSAEPVVVPNTSPFHGPFLYAGLIIPSIEADGLIDKVSANSLVVHFGRAMDRFDEALGGFDTITGHGAELHFAVNEDGAIRRVIPSHVPQAVFIQIHSRNLKIGDERLILEHELLPFLATTITQCGFTEGHMTLALKSLKRMSHGMDATYGDFSFSFTLDDGTVITHKDLSYGQKRLLSFLYHLALRDDVVVADELVNGLHYDWIEACIQEIGDRQAFLTSQNPILLDFLPFESAEQVRQSFVLCRLERREGGSVMLWKNLDADAAEEFFRSYKTRALQVSEILRMQGLW